jgi:iron complex transport system substrate-binding protein
MYSFPNHPRILAPLLLALVVLLAACEAGTASPPPAATPTPTVALDNNGVPITFPSTPPQRIISLVPNASEMLGALHLEGRVVGVDTFTNYPASLASVPRVADANEKFNIEQIVALKPDLILGYGGETKQTDTQLEALKLNVVDLPLSNLTGMLQEVLLVGRLTFTLDTATKLVSELQQRINAVRAKVAGTTASKVMIEIDYSTPGKPYVIGGGGFDDEVLHDANAQNVFGANSGNGGYPQVSDEAVISANPQYIILTEDPRYGGNAASLYKRANWSGIAALKLKQVYNLNGNLLSRPDPRLVEGLQCVAQLLHPDKFPGSLPADCTGTV